MEVCGATMRNGDKCMNVGLPKFDGRCGKNHPDPNAPVNAALTLVLARALGAAAVDPTFNAKAASTTHAEPYAQRIAHILSYGTDNAGAELVHGVRCSHATQPSNNCTVWYSWAGNTMTVWGLGSHKGGSGAGNDKYTMTWFDGTSKNWSR